MTFKVFCFVNKFKRTTKPKTKIPFKFVFFIIMKTSQIIYEKSSINKFYKLEQTVPTLITNQTRIFQNYLKKKILLEQLIFTI